MRFEWASFVFICWVCVFKAPACFGAPCGGKNDGTCPRGQKCQAIETGCENTPLYQACVPEVFYSCCPDTCRIKCLYGFKPDGNNCTLCECLPNPCDNVECLPPRKCYPYYSYKRIHYVAICACDEFECQLCPRGFAYENGCKTCRCLSTCDNAVCPPSHACVNYNNGAYGCEPRFDVCPYLKCEKLCLYGYKSDEKNCHLCECLPNPCDGVNCISPQTCHPRLSSDSNEPSYEARCECPEVKCLPCLNGYIYQNSCQTCQCFDICSKVRCPDNQVCTAHAWGRYDCKPVSQAMQCPPVDCQPCQAGYVTDTNGCKTCECKENCQGSSCVKTKPVPCADSCEAILCEGNSTCCSDDMGCYGCRRRQDCAPRP